MSRLEPLWLILATLTDKQLGHSVEFLREENRILRIKLPERIEITLRERSRLLRFGRKLGSAILGEKHLRHLLNEFVGR